MLERSQGLGLTLLFGLAALASSPLDAGVPDAVRAVLAGCEGPELALDRPETTADVLERHGAREVRVRTVEGPAGSGAYLTLTTWLVAPASCRKVALQVHCMGGNPRCAATFLHAPGKTASTEERATLVSWLPGRRLDPRSPGHQEAVTPALARLPEQPEPSTDQPAPGTPAAPFTVRAVKQPPPRWLPGAPAAQTPAWLEVASAGPSSEEGTAGGPPGYVSSGRAYAVHRGEGCVRVDGVEAVGTARLHTFSSPSRLIDRTWYLALEQPARHRTAWLVHAGTGLRTLGTSQGRLWLTVPAFMDPGFSWLAVDLESGASWHVDLERTASFDPSRFLPVSLGPAGIVLQSAEGEAAEAPSLTVPWARLNAALQAARPSPGP